MLLLSTWSAGRQAIANSSTSAWVERPDFAIDEIREVVFKRLDILRADYDDTKVKQLEITGKRT
ncbi:uncharacterized protein ASPGLDRAFT_35267 [Aspergillus glaucus CBS 516.65]|uniref:Uncharacterized protein n=1 Tax=Aspergillus glaucus CBS 516.65 TaxID=1160497 RepID=A0A1L9VLQ8_ASPGL|nr:hypothetical protein ASPGLDRAFT_35267 [Aspergillus glaucus CBS 516.65]OJJ84810.1 hypothetical protein ASPGLDRAFT_35267 [Aspergillus glaucus CBS 516.65]